MRRKKNSFLDHLEYYLSIYLPMAKGLSSNTIVSYKATFRILMEYMYSIKGVPADKVDFNILDDKLIIEFLDWLEATRGCSAATRNQRLSAIAAFSMYAQNRDFNAATAFRNSVLKVPRKKTPQKVRSSFSRDEVKILLALPNAGTEIGLRDKTLLCFMYASGTRAQEVCDLTVGDIQFCPDRAGINIHGKGQKVRRIGIPYEASGILKKYIAHKGITNAFEAHVFSSQTHEKMTVSCVEEIFEKYIIRAKREHPTQFRYNYTPHSMRHTTATHMLEAGVPLVVVKNFLGHVSLQTTQIYTEISQDTLDRQLKLWNDKWFLKDDHSRRDAARTGNVPAFLV